MLKKFVSSYGVMVLVFCVVMSQEEKPMASLEDLLNWLGRVSETNVQESINGCSKTECNAYFACSINNLFQPTEKQASCRDDIKPCCIKKSTEAVKCGLRNPDGIHPESVEGDNVAQYGEFPWMVVVFTKSGEEPDSVNVYKCGGSLIHPQVVLTAAHCVRGTQTKDLRIRVGEWDTRSKDELLPHYDRDVEEVIVHPKYVQKEFHNDIALVILTSPVNLGGVAQTVCLPPQGFQLDTTRCVVTTWSKEHIILSQFNLSIIPNEECENSLRKTQVGLSYSLHSNFVCAGGENDQDKCKGSGGSPLVCPILNQTERYHQTGVVSWNFGCNNSAPGLFSNVALHRSWIDEVFLSRKLDTSFYTF